MNENSTRLVTAARDALAALPSDRTSVEEDARVATIATLRQLAIMMEEDEAEGGGEWPDAGDLWLLADDVEESL